MSSGIGQWTNRDRPTMNVSWRSKINERPLSGPSNTTRVTCINSFRQRRLAGRTRLRFESIFRRILRCLGREDDGSRRSSRESSPILYVVEARNVARIRKNAESRSTRLLHPSKMRGIAGLRDDKLVRTIIEMVERRVVPRHADEVHVIVCRDDDQDRRLQCA